MPLDASLDVNTSEKPKFRLRLIWLFGLISKELSRKGEKPKEKPKRKGRVGFSTILKILRTKGLLKQLRNLVKGILGQLKIRELMVNLSLGLDDPADTGLLFAVVGATTPFINLPSQYQIKVQPYFHDKDSFEGYIHGLLRLQPISLIGPLLRFTFSLAVLRVVKILVLRKWKRK